MTNDKYDIEIAEFNSADIRHVAKEMGATHMRHIGGGYADGRADDDNAYVDFYALPHPDGWEIKVADTNGDPVWEEDEGFFDLAESCCVAIQ